LFLNDLISSTKRYADRKTVEIRRIGNDEKIILRGIFIIEVTARSLIRYLIDPGIAREKNIIIKT
jgi:hypothetical protein